MRKAEDLFYSENDASDGDRRNPYITAAVQACKESARLRHGTVCGYAACTKRAAGMRGYAARSARQNCSVDGEWQEMCSTQGGNTAVCGYAARSARHGEYARRERKPAAQKRVRNSVCPRRPNAEEFIITRRHSPTPQIRADVPSLAHLHALSAREHQPFGDAVRVLPGESPIGECPQSAVRKSGRCANQSRRSASALRYISSASPAIRETE